MTVATGIPGVVCQYPNKFIERLTSPAWCELLSALGRGGELVMVDLLVDCALFCPCSNHEGLQQVSGVPISQLSVLKSRSDEVMNPQEVRERRPQPQVQAQKKSAAREWSAIRFVRSRMFYAKPTMNTGRAVRLGLRHIHVLNRFHVRDSEEQTAHVMRYIFPRQFGLHNVFTSEVNPRETAQAFKDYTLREQEIAYERQKAESSLSNDRDRLKPHLKIPKRLRGQALQLIRNLRRNHERCLYVELLRHHCPTDLGQQTPGTKSDPTALATPHANVSAFCRQVIDRVFPKEFWGSGNNGEKNAAVISRNVDMFIRLRKGEGLTLHDVLQDIQISAMTWLQPAKCSGKMSQSDFQKRKEILAELVYYVFDSFLIPLIRSNFHVTESNVHRNRLFYFRHDVWRQLTEPTFAELKSSTFEEMKPADARKLLINRTLGYSAIRLLPKATGFRPIANLRRRMLVWQNGKQVLGRSINSILNPTFKVLNFEKVRDL
jgi:telomerase reverse transcriptase